MANSTTQSNQFDPDQLDRDPWGWWRSQMPITKKWAYFDHAAVAPLPAPAVDAIAEFQRQASEDGDTVWPTWNGRLNVLREQFAELTGAEDGEICLMPNTTAGINLVAEGFDWRPGDSIVLPDGEFPSNLFPWLHQEPRGLEVRQVPRRDGQVILDDLFEQVDETTRMIAVSWVGYASGYRIDVEELVQRAHERGVLVFLDAIQGLGIYPLDLRKTPVDFMAADGHKWLLGPEGAGMAMIRREHLSKLRCVGVGWNSVQNAHKFSGASFDLRDDAVRYEGGSMNMIGLAALSASVEMFLQVRRHHGENAIGARIIELASYLNDRLSDRGIPSRLPTDDQNRSGIVTFEVPGMDSAKVRQAAMEKSMVVSCRGGGIRASIHAYNTHDEIDRLVDVAANVV